MRDDLHKTAPVPRHWKMLVRLGGREADQSRLPDVARKAIIGDCKAELDIQALRAPSLFASGPQNGLTAQFHECLRLTPQGDQDHRVSGALAQALRSRADARMNQIEAHCLQEGGPKARPMVERMRSAVASAPIEDDAAAIVRDNALPKIPRTRKDFDVDEDLL